MARKKIVFVIVEGPSDEAALGVLFNRIYDRDTVHVHIIHGDITTRYGVNENNIVSKISEIVSRQEKQYHFTKSDFREIIHIIDTDGAYIPDENVVDDSSVTKPVYSVTEIRTRNKSGIEYRNRVKSANIDELCTCKDIRGVPYRVFYMSCNLDHVLYNKLNSSDREKETDAYNFAQKYKKSIPKFMKFISESDFSVVTGYDESWKFIKEDLHSLERHTNLGLCFQNNEHNDD